MIKFDLQPIVPVPPSKYNVPRVVVVDPDTGASLTADTHTAALMSDPATALQAATKAAVLPTGGTTGQVLSKASATNFDVKWADAAVGGATAGSGFGPNWVAASNSAPSVKAAVQAAGGLVCDGTGDQIEFNTQLGTYGHVQFAIGDYNFASTLTLPARRWLQGSGPNSQIIGASGASSRLIYVTADHAWLTDFTISAGAEAAGTHHIEANITSSTGFITGQDACLIIERVVSRNSKGRGVSLTGTNNRDSKLSKIHVWNATSDGYYINTPDGNATQLIAGTCGGNGVWLDSGSSNWTITGSKAWYSVRDGWLIDGIRSKFTSIEGQDNVGAGIRIIGNNLVLTGLVADSNSYDKSPSTAITGITHAGVEVGRTFAQANGGGFDISLNGVQSWDKNEGSRGFRQAYGVRLRTGLRGLTMSGVQTGDPAGSHHNVTAGIQFDTSTDKDNANNLVRACLNHRVRFESV